MKPTIGRIVLFTDNQAEEPIRSLPGIIQYVGSDDGEHAGRVDIAVFYDTGVLVVTKVPEAGTEAANGARYTWSWPPRA